MKIQNIENNFFKENQFFNNKNISREEMLLEHTKTHERLKEKIDSLSIPSQAMILGCLRSEEIHTKEFGGFDVCISEIAKQIYQLEKEHKHEAINNLISVVKEHHKAHQVYIEDNKTCLSALAKIEGSIKKIAEGKNIEYHSNLIEEASKCMIDKDNKYHEKLKSIQKNYIEIEEL